MEVHKAKPVHGWRALLNEIGVIVLGVLIALGAEQTVEALHWHHKVELAEASLDAQLGRDLAFAAEQRAMHACNAAYLDLLEWAIVHNQPQIIRGLYDIGSPHISRPWQVDAWDAALNSQIPDHLNRSRLTNYGLAFRSVLTEREIQFKLMDSYARAVTGRYGLPTDPQVINDQLAALGKYRSDRGIATAISEGLLDDVGKQLGVVPDQGLIRGSADRAATCEAGVRALTPDALRQSDGNRPARSP